MKQPASKRIKRVFSNHSEVCHIWASQSQSDARCKNVFFEGTSIYSYGYHYELGRLIEFNGKKVALINTRGYSVTTSKHIWSAKDATSHLIRVDMPNGISADKSSIREALVNKQDELVSSLFKHFNERKCWTKYSGEYGMDQSVERFNSTVRELGFSDLALDVNETFISIYDEHTTYREGINEALRAEDNARRELQRQEDAVKAQGVLAEWKKGGPRDWCLNSIRPQQIRIKDDQVETTSGATVPVSHALKLLRLIDSGLVKSGQRIGHYEFESVKKGIVTIGCHEIDLNEARSVLSQIPTLSVVSND